MNNALYPRSTQDIMDDMEYHGFDNNSSSVTTSPYSPRSAEDSSSNYNASVSGATVRSAPSQPILKNGGGTLPRSHSRASTSYGTLDRTKPNHSRYNSMDFTRPPSSARSVPMNNNNVNNPTTNLSVGNGSVVSSCSSSVMSSRFRNGRYFTDATNANNNANGENRVISNPSEDMDFPLPPKRAASMQIIATPHRPCCDWNGCMTKYFGGGDSGQPTPICVLFAIFLLFSLLVVSGVLIYLRGGKTNNYYLTLLTFFHLCFSNLCCHFHYNFDNSKSDI